MNIMAFVGSPRKGSNVDTLVDRVIAGAESIAAVGITRITRGHVKRTRKNK